MSWELKTSLLTIIPAFISLIEGILSL